jgi:class 3 adenylate cyclase
VRVRIGIHSGEASAAGERYAGFSVHRAARAQIDSATNTVVASIPLGNYQYKPQWLFLLDQLWAR